MKMISKITLPKPQIAAATICALITFVVFLPSLQNEFILWDDDVYVYNNPCIRSLDTCLLKTAFTSFCSGLWHPLALLSHAIDYAVWGLNPFGHHLTSNILHALNTFIIVLLVMKLLGAYRQRQDAIENTPPVLHDKSVIIAGAVAGLLFGIHPLRVESVAWVSERKDLLCAFFYLLTIAAYMRYVDDIRTDVSSPVWSRMVSRRYFLALGLFALALMSKPMAVSLPVVLLILDWYLYKRIRSVGTFRTAFVDKIPFIILSLAVSIVTLSGEAPSMMSLDELPLGSRLILAAEALIFYLAKVLAPVHLVPLYPIPQDLSIFSFQHVLSILIVVLITAACMAAMRRHKIWMALWAYYVITLAPILDIVKVDDAAMADRYTYLPSLGVFLIVGLSAAVVHEKISLLKQWGSALRISGYVITITVAAYLSYNTIHQIWIWKDSSTFWTYVDNEFPDRNPVAINNLGVIYTQQHHFKDAINKFKTLIRINMGDATAHRNLGRVYMMQGRFNDAIMEFEAVIMIDPSDAKPHVNLGAAYARLNRNDLALKEYTIALDLDPSLAEAHNNIGLIYADLHRIDQAIQEYTDALILNPVYPEAHNNLGNAFAFKQRYTEAIGEYRAALALRSDFIEAHYNLGNAFAAAGSLDQAIAEYHAAIALDPDEPDAHKHLGDAYLEQNRPYEAAKEHDIALKLAVRKDPCLAP